MGVRDVQLNEAVSRRLRELMAQKHMTGYALSAKSGIPKSTIGNILNCTFDSMKLRVLHDICQGLGIGIPEFFPLFEEDNLEP